ncbi:NfeD family protein [Parenemella sanctibonifatiensis]|uniref:Nodulation efficiency protein D n=1 Tax=Parenemella sanctibonifatiensis TaxID=2016505 RepID=A0A255DZ85_9ACTN|nr:NfeD family protein [Parenemella sanctibonifatiensis]OYN84604.1 nodulation efficiency protein D [Parenemella sanctibonifatiensis]
MVDWIRDNPWALWLAAAFGLGALELLSGDFVLLMLAGGAVGGTLAALLLPGVVWAQVIIALATATLLLLLVRPALKRRMALSKGYRTLHDQLLGAEGRTTSAVGEVDGTVKIEGQDWTARPYVPGTTIEAGQPVEVLGVEGVVALVHPLHQPLDPVRD